MNKTIAIGIVLLTIVFGASTGVSIAGVLEPIPLWPRGAPGEKVGLDKEADTTTATGHLVAGRRVTRLGSVSVPTITIYQPPEGKGNGAAVVVCPGGGYYILAMDIEGTEVCEWLNSIGVTAILLKYRVPTRPGDDKHILPLQDAQRAFGLVRFHASEWHVDPKRIGVLGFSAGGHLAANLSNNYGHRAYESMDGADQVSCRPDFSLLIYPAYLVAKDRKNLLSPDLNVTTNTPPTFLVQTEDDGMGAENSLCYCVALKNAMVPVELHLYSAGGHGYGLRKSDKPVSNWPGRAEDWMRASGVLENKTP